MAKVERRFSWGWLVVVLAVLVAGGYIWWSRQDHRERAALGRVVRAGAFTSGQVITVMTPAGKVTVRVADRVRELPEGADVRASDLRAPAEGSFVGVRIDAAELSRPILRTATATEVKVPELTLVADGHRYPLGSLRPGRADSLSGLSGTRSGYVAVAGTKGPAQLEVAFDGERGSFGLWDGGTDPGRFGSSEEPPYPADKVTCDEPRTISPAYALQDMRLSACRYASVRAAYVTGLGWAAPGKDWLAVAVGLKPKVVVAPGSAVYGPVGSPVMTYVFGANTKPTATNSPRGATPILFTAIPTSANLTLTASVRYTATQEDWAAKANHSPKSLAIAATWILPVA